jgi:DNA mismatch endonuclease (patch repair protein)
MILNPLRFLRGLVFVCGRMSTFFDRMSDIWSKEKRSEVMGKVKSSGNRSTEQKLISVFREFGITGWRRHQELPGKPDFVFRKSRVAVFVDGCFWHGCPKCYRRPKSNQEFWDAKFTRNRARDRAVSRGLRAMGWSVLRIWEHSLKHPETVARRVCRHTGS